MTPASNSGARKRIETSKETPTVLVEMPVDQAEKAVYWLGQIDCLEDHDAVMTLTLARLISAALAARITGADS